MKLIDKYLLREYVVPLICCLLGFCVLYVISGLFDKASDFIRAGVTLSQIFYFYGLFLLAYADQSNVSFLVTVLPVSLLAAALYSLTRLTRQNEITAMCASGISVIRLMVPYLGVGLVCSMAASVVQEFIAPNASRLTDVFLAEHGKKSASPVATSGRYYDSRDG
ncbi:MAG: LptF/LptG family permease, partial [bacterium]